MFLKTSDEDYKHAILNSCDVPRSIFWVSTLSKAGVPNLAPYSFSSAVAYKPPQVIFSQTGPRRNPDGTIRDSDSVTNARDTGEFVVNFVPYQFREQMSQTSAAIPPEENEFDFAGLESIPSTLVKPPGVKISPIRLECRLQSIIDLIGDYNRMVVGEVLGFHISDDILTRDGAVDWTKYQPVARMGRSAGYTHVTDVWFLDRPKPESYQAK